LKPSFQTFCAAVATGGTLFSTAVWPHGGEDHGQAGANKRVVQPAHPVPRAAAATDAVELVAALEDDRLMVYLDRFATGEPIAGAKLEVESGSFKATATALDPGVYALPAQAFTAPGAYPLTISVEAGDVFDLLSLTLENRDSETAVAAAPAHGAWPVWGASAGVALAGVGLVLVRQRRQDRRKHG